MDLPKLTQVFRSLLENAIQHSPRGGTVRLEGHIVPIYGRTWAECRVLDQGSGFAREVLHRLFQPFLGRREGRSGLGLALSRRIVEEHCGQIAAGNNPEGGAWVRVRLPLLEADHGR
jgi:signal transduction histidine kinase